MTLWFKINGNWDVFKLAYTNISKELHIILELDCGLWQILNIIFILDFFKSTHVHVITMLLKKILDNIKESG